MADFATVEQVSEDIKNGKMVVVVDDEDREKRIKRLIHYYGNDNTTKEYKRRPHIFLFNPGDLDNEDVILAVENTPTYRRSKQLIDEIRRQASGFTADDNGDKPHDHGNEVQGVISFV